MLSECRGWGEPEMKSGMRLSSQISLFTSGLRQACTRLMKSDMAQKGIYTVPPFCLYREWTFTRGPGFNAQHTNVQNQNVKYGTQTQYLQRATKYILPLILVKKKKNRNKNNKRKKQESRAIAQMTARCAQCMGALKIFGTP